MPRRGHKKSRLGCAECKKRHLKCDETKPFCVNCKTAGVKCSYEKDFSYLTPREDSRPSSHTSPAPSIEANFNDVPIKPIPFRSPGETHVNLDHLELLHNFQTETFKSFITNPEIAYNYMNTAVRCGLEHPFLMYEALALSSLHLSLHRPSRADFYQRQSADLQALAVQGFNGIMMDINDDNCLAVFVFSSMMGLHAFCETFVSFNQSSDFNRMLDHFTDSMKLIRGILVVMDGFWPTLAESELKDMLREGGYSQIKVTEDEECKMLREMLSEADLSEKSRGVYDKVVTELQRAIKADRLSEDSSRVISSVFAWVVTTSEDFTSALRQRRPEALVILSHYAVLLHRKRNAWVIQGAGRFIVLAIKEYLGSHWLRWLEWPLTAIGEGHQASSTTTPSTLGSLTSPPGAST